MTPFYDKDGYALYHGDCVEAMKSLPAASVDIVITSPPYNTCRSGLVTKVHEKDKYQYRYDVFVESRTADEYVEWSAEVFRELDRVLKKDRVVLYNFGMGNDGHSQSNSCADWFSTVSGICAGTSFAVADLLLWKKKCALPNNMSINKSTRIAEPVIVFCRKDELMTFKANKRQSSEFKTGQKLYSPFYNIFEARNNDGSNSLNKATYSTQFVDVLIDLYCPERERAEWTVLDPFSGTGTTGLSALSHGMKYVGIELSESQCQYTVDRLAKGVEQFLF